MRVGSIRKKVREITVVGERQMIVWNDMDLNEPVRIYHKSVDVERDPGYVDSFGTSACWSAAATW